MILFIAQPLLWYRGRHFPCVSVSIQKLFESEGPKLTRTAALPTFSIGDLPSETYYALRGYTTP